MYKKIFIYSFILIVTVSCLSQSQFQPQHLFDVKWIDDLALSPDGEWIAFTVKTYLLDSNTSNTDIYRISSQGGEIRQLTSCPDDDGHPVWSPDGSLLAFLSNRTGSKQIFILPMDGGEARQLSQVNGDIELFQWSPDGRYFACLISKIDAGQTSPYNELRGQWHPTKTYTLAVLPIDGSTILELKELNLNNFIFYLENGLNFTISSNGNEILFTELSEESDLLSVNLELMKTSLTNNKLYTLSKNKALDMAPLYSPDNRYIAYLASSKINHLYDQKDIILLHNKNKYMENLTTGFDLDIDKIVWGPKSDCLYFSAKDQGRNVLFSIKIKNKKIKGLLHSGFNTHLTISPDERFLYFIRSMANTPPEIFRCTEKGDNLYQLTFLNRSLTKKFSFNPVEDIWYSTTSIKLIHSLMLKPPNFDPTLKYPLLILIHDGPHNCWNDQFSLHWNYQIFLSQGYLVAAFNIRGSQGYGQLYADQSQKNWSALFSKDILAGIDYIKNHYSFVDDKNIMIAGEGFGGYMVYWSQTYIHPPFRCGISHNGIMNPVSLFGCTSIPMHLYWEFGGIPSYDDKFYTRLNPALKIKDLKMPILITHCENDPIIPSSQSLEAYTLFSTYSEPLKFNLYKNESHTLSKPQNIKHWYELSIDWLKKWKN